MKEALAKALVAEDERIDAQVDRVLAASFFRTRPLQAGSLATANNVRSLEAMRSRRKGFGSHFS
ncbi:MAG: hypothetical protein JST00_29935 [Deltaproteobacteria bacterium]|nr:hypothetical protein [Deltaproteobacteria bacterium]